MNRALLPNRRAAEIRIFEHDGRRYRVTFGYFANGNLGELFLDIDKPNSAIQVHADDAAVLVSLLLQHGVPPSSIRRSISGPIRRALDLWIEDISHER
jgi:hypothetical protein